MRRLNTGRFTRAKKILRRLVPEPVLKARKLRRGKQYFSGRSYEEIFQKIHEDNHWNNDESVSGGGSTLEFTRSIPSELEDWLTRNNVSSFADIPCGDFN